MKAALISALVVAAVSTIGDYLWANVFPHGRSAYWFAHAIVLFFTVGVCLGWPSRQAFVGAVGAVLIGCAATLSFGFLRLLIGYDAIVVLFAALWIALGVLTVRVLQQRRDTREVVVRSTLAAIGAGVGFYVISGIWFPFHPHGWDYAVHFVKWTVAYFPAFAALLVGRRM